MAFFLNNICRQAYRHFQAAGHISSTAAAIRCSHDQQWNNSCDSLMVDTKQVSEKLDFNSELMRLIAWEYLTTFSSRKKMFLRLLKSLSNFRFPVVSFRVSNLGLRSPCTVDWPLVAHPSTDTNVYLGDIVISTWYRMSGIENRWQRSYYETLIPLSATGR